MITTREVVYPADGLTMVGYLARPAGDEPAPAVLIGHDGIGLDDAQRAYADDLARRGYVALAMEYHGGRWFSDPQELLARVLPLIADRERMRAIGEAAFRVLMSEPGVEVERLGAVGLGAGGSIVLELARAGVPWRVVAAVHPGLPDARPEDWTGVTGTVLLATGSEDPLCTPEQLLTFGRVLQGAGIDWRANVHGAAAHAFWHPPVDLDGFDHAAHHPQQARRLWHDIVALLDERLPATAR